jgi:hypothetical protein
MRSKGETKGQIAPEATERPLLERLKPGEAAAVLHRLPASSSANDAPSQQHPSHRPFHTSAFIPCLQWGKYYFRFLSAKDGFTGRLHPNPGGTSRPSSIRCKLVLAGQLRSQLRIRREKSASRLMSATHLAYTAPPVRIAIPGPPEVPHAEVCGVIALAGIDRE